MLKKWIVLGSLIALCMIIVLYLHGATVSPAHNNDDFYTQISSTSYVDDGTSVNADTRGNAADNYHASVRFQLNIPQGATVLSATMTVKCSNGQAGNNFKKVTLHDADDSPQITTYAGWNTAHGNLTSGVDWDVVTTVTDTEYTTPSLVAIFQEVIDRGGWSANNFIHLFVDDDGSTTWLRFQWYSFNHGSDYAVLTYTYEEEEENAIFFGMNFLVCLGLFFAAKRVSKL